jgi:hypothetical protein
MDLWMSGLGSDDGSEEGNFELFELALGVFDDLDLMILPDLPSYLCLPDLPG